MVIAPYTSLISHDGGGDPLARFHLEHPATGRDSDDAGASALFRGLAPVDVHDHGDTHGSVEAIARASLLHDDPTRSVGEREAELAERVPITQDQVDALVTREGTADAPNAVATAARDAAIHAFAAEHHGGKENVEAVAPEAAADATAAAARGGVPLTEYTDGLGPHFGKGPVAESTAGTGHPHGRAPKSKACPDCPLPHAWMVPARALNTCKAKSGATYSRVGLGGSKGCAKLCKWPKMIAAQKCTPDPPFVARVPYPTSKKEFRKYQRAGKPVVFTGMFPEFAEGGADAWTFDKLGERLGKFTFTVRYGDYGQSVSRRRFTEMKMRKYLEIVRAPRGPGLDDKPPPYLGNNRLSSAMVKAMGLDFPPYYPKKEFLRPSLWFGKRGSLTPLHTDGPDNFCVQLIGRKRFVLFSPTEEDNLYLPVKTRDLSINWSKVGAIVYGEGGAGLEAKRREFPLLARTRPLVLDLHPGDVYYQPAGWAHTVENLDDSLMVNFWLRSRQMIFSTAI